MQSFSRSWIVLKSLQHFYNVLDFTKLFWTKLPICQFVIVCSPDSVSYWVLTSSVGRAACVRFRAWVLVALQGAAAAAVCVWELGRWRRCRVPLVCALGSATGVCAWKFGCWCCCCVHLGAWVLVPLSLPRVRFGCLVPLQGAAAVCACELGCWRRVQM